MEHDRLHAFASALLRLILWTLGAILAVLAGTVLVFRVWGVPDSWQQRLRQELAQRGIHVEYRKLYVDPTGHLVIRDALWRDAPPDAATVFRAERIRCGIAWLSWWRREPFLSSIEIIDGTLEIRLDAESTAAIRKVRLLARLTGEEFVVESLRGRLPSLEIEGDGRIPWSCLRSAPEAAPPKPPAPSNLASLAPLWRQVEQISAQIQSRRPIDLRVNLRAAPEPGRFAADAFLVVPDLVWRGIHLLGAEGTLSFQEGVFRMPALQARLDDGANVRVSARADLAERRGLAVIETTGSPAWLVPLLPEHARPRFQRLRFDQTPSVRCEVLASWQERFSARTLLDLDWQDFEYGGRKIEHFTVPAAFDGTRFFVPEAVIEAGGETTVLRLLRDGDAGPIRGELRGTLNPALFQDLLPAGAQPFMDSCQFTEGIRLDLDCQGASTRPGEWKLSGDVDVRNAQYKGVPLRRVAAKVACDGARLDLGNVVLARPEGEGTCPTMSYDFSKRLLEIHGAQGQLHVQETAHLFGGNFEKYCQPYRFESPPSFNLDGLIDLGGGELSSFDLKVRGGPMLYKFLGVDVPPRTVRAGVRFRGMRMSIDSLNASIYDGSLGMKGDFDFSSREARFNLDFDVRQASFERVMRSFFKVEDVSGTLNGKISLRGIVDRLDTLDGSGRAEIQDGFLLKIPVFGGISALMSVVIPNFGYAKAGNAGCDFTVENGVVHWDEIAITSATFAMICGGEYNIVRDRLDADARVNVRGPVGFMLFPVSKLFEYRGVGPLKDVKWGAKLLGH